MAGIRVTRALIVLTVIASLAVLPAAAQAAPRDSGRDEGGVSLLASLFDWVSSIWGAGGGNWDPTGRQPTTAGPEPTMATSPEGGISAPSVLRADREKADRTTVVPTT